MTEFSSHNFHNCIFFHQIVEQYAQTNRQFFQVILAYIKILHNEILEYKSETGLELRYCAAKKQRQEGNSVRQLYDSLEESSLLRRFLNGIYMGKVSVTSGNSLPDFPPLTKKSAVPATATALCVQQYRKDGPAALDFFWGERLCGRRRPTKEISSMTASGNASTPHSRSCRTQLPAARTPPPR